MEDRKLEELIKRIDLEIDSDNAGSKAYRESLQRSNFNNSYLENCYEGTYKLTPIDDDIEFVDSESVQDDKSTFDESNYSAIDLFDNIEEIVKEQY